MTRNLYSNVCQAKHIKIHLLVGHSLHETNSQTCQPGLLWQGFRKRIKRARPADTTAAMARLPQTRNASPPPKKKKESVFSPSLIQCVTSGLKSVSFPMRPGVANSRATSPICPGSKARQARSKAKTLPRSANVNVSVEHMNA